MNDLPQIDPNRRVLGVIRPTVESIDSLTSTRHIGVLATPGTIKSESYPLEINKLYPDISVVGESCPMWVPIVENNESDSDGASFFIKKNLDSLLDKDPLIDTLILGCTHYPILISQIKRLLPNDIHVVAQGEYVASSLKDYLMRHPEMENKCTKNGTMAYYTTESIDIFKESATRFLEETVEVERIVLE